MRRRERQFHPVWRSTLLACGLAILLALQALSGPLAFAANAAKSQGDRVVADLVTLGAWCAHDAGEGSGGKTDRAHVDCCVLCQSGARAVATVLVFFTADLVDPPRAATAPAAWADAGDAPPRVIGWASSWSSRAPPFFS